MEGLVVEVSPLVAVLGSFLLSSSFVASMHLWKLAGFTDANRDDTGTIQRRFLSALLSCAFAAVLLVALARRAGSGDRGLSALELLGLESDRPAAACAQCLALTAGLFVGPLAQHWVLVLEGRANVISLPGGPWVAARNYILAPFTEEFVFRACLVRLWVGAAFPRSMIIFVSPFCFGMAHAHHYIEQVRRCGNKNIALMQVAFQVFYTWLFGMFSNFLLMQTGSTLAVILTHTFCNHQGFPDLGFLQSSFHPLHKHRSWLGMVYLIGIALFCWLIMPLTGGFHSTFQPLQALTDR